jgi:hypothetical protein
MVSMSKVVARSAVHQRGIRLYYGLTVPWHGRLELARLPSKNWRGPPIVNFTERLND